jgi:hypothetical protein
MDTVGQLSVGENTACKEAGNDHNVVAAISSPRCDAARARPVIDGDNVSAVKASD